MGKIKVIGSAKHEYEPDKCRIGIGIHVKREHAAEASKISSDQCELLLQKLTEIGFATDMIEIFTDSINEPSPYHSDDMNYESIKELRIYTKADVHIITAVFSDNRCSNRFFLVSAGIFVG